VRQLQQFDFLELQWSFFRASLEERSYAVCDLGSRSSTSTMHGAAGWGSTRTATAAAPDMQWALAHAAAHQQHNRAAHVCQITLQHADQSFVSCSCRRWCFAAAAQQSCAHPQVAGHA
jgi:hypothetical protein